MSFVVGLSAPVKLNSSSLGVVVMAKVSGPLL